MPALKGRDAQLEMLRDAMARAAARHLTMVMVEGEAAIGKSRLPAAALDVARGRDLHVISGRSEELERNRPFGLWADALGCVPSAPDPRRAALGGLLAPRPGGHEPITVSSDPGLQFRPPRGPSGPLTRPLDVGRLADVPRGVRAQAEGMAENLRCGTGGPVRRLSR
jgi:hypothetical protein